MNIAMEVNVLQNSAKILVVDDDPNVIELIKLYADMEGFTVVGVNNGDLALSIFNRESPDVIVLDLMLPGINGILLCRKFREIQMVPIIMLTARGEEADRILGLEMGADDYVSKPFSPRELMARIKAVLRRTSILDSSNHINIKYPGLEIMSDLRKILVNGNEIEMTPKEFDLLYYLAQSPLRVFSREDLLSAIWGCDYFGDQRTVDVHIRRLRKKLSPLEHEYLTTVWGIGYKFTPPLKVKEVSYE